jgi:hypothetical protein
MRYWFLTRDGSELVQVQQDRLAVNWRDGESGSPYPRYPAMRQVFAERFADLEAFAIQEGTGPVRVQQAELSYVNAVGSGATGTHRLDRVLSTWRTAAGHHLGEPEQARIEMSFQVKDLPSGGCGDEPDSGPPGGLPAAIQPHHGSQMASSPARWTNQRTAAARVLPAAAR